MGIFDASNRDQCEVKRLRTNTPLQALMMMNDPMVLEASRVLAERLIEENSEVREKIVKAFRLIVCRTPGDQEITLLQKAFETELASLSPESAGELLKAGEFPSLSKADPVKVAALMLVVNTIYNLEESITKT
jgi:hypothetical protein